MSLQKSSDQQRKYQGRKSTVAFSMVGPKTASPSARNTRRITMCSDFDRSSTRPRIIYMPTYRMASQRPINIEHITFVMKNTVLSMLNQDPLMAVYGAERAMRCCKYMTNEIRFRLKLLRYDRYRFVVLVNIVEKRCQATHWQMGFLWDIDTDQWTSFQHDMQTYTITVIVLAVYWE